MILVSTNFLKWQMKIPYIIKDIHILKTEIYKVLHGLSPPIMSKIFTKKDCPYSLRNPRSLITNCKSTVKYGIDSIVYLQTLPTDLRNSEWSSMFKCNIKNLRDINWQCEICKIYIRNVGYVAWRQQKVIGLHIYKICNIKYIYVYVYL